MKWQNHLDRHSNFGREWCLFHFQMLFVLFSPFLIKNTCLAQDVSSISVQGRECLYDKWDLNCAKNCFEKVIKHRHAPAFVLSDYGWYLLLEGRYKEGLLYIKQATEKDPNDKQLITWYAWALLWEEKLDKAEKEVNKALKIDPIYGEALYVASMIQSEKENHALAIQLAEKAAKADLNWRVVVPFSLVKSGNPKQALIKATLIGKDPNAFDCMLLTEVYAMLGKNDLALDYLEKAYDLKHPFMPWILLIPTLKHLHKNPRFLKIVKKLNLP